MNGFFRKIKKEVREKSGYQCILCGEKIVEVHHVQPRSQGGEDTFENAAALCSQCHTLYGNNPRMKKEILEKRDMAYKKQEEIQKKIEEHKFIKMKKGEGMARIPIQEETSLIRCYISEKENFNQAAQKIFNAIISDQNENPKEQKKIQSSFLKICDTKEEWEQLKEREEYFALNEMEEENGEK